MTSNLPPGVYETDPRGIAGCSRCGQLVDLDDGGMETDDGRFFHDQCAADEIDEAASILVEWIKDFDRSIDDRHHRFGDERQKQILLSRTHSVLKAALEYYL